jgi:hypothetical protein
LLETLTFRTDSNNVYKQIYGINFAAMYENPVQYFHKLTKEGNTEQKLVATYK